ncbi:hypothetical protein KBX26_02630 [Micromonospora sp. C97]|uniref:hypothetical protein n=1 Tax=Micromonospora sp. C97 TaxID=2824883 RepID=UPI001B37043D|nr:hypothetical protein [Micromonospora sp. C97]MBQ1028903.1 hypothetical protein [Micromonospora sp. C97]
MTSYAIRSCSEPPASMRWLAQQFPHRAWLIADLQGRISRAPAAIHACAPEPDRFGQAMERTLALDLCEAPPYLHLIKQLPAAGRRRLLATAGYAPTTDTPDGPWRKTTDHIPGARLFTVGSLLPDLNKAVHARRANPDEAREVIEAVLRDRRAITAYATAAHAARPAFAAFWASYTSGFRNALRGCGPVTASLSLLGGLRIADFLAGTTIVEYKTGHFDDAYQLDALAEQVLAYALLAPGSGHLVTAVVMYLARYHVLARYPLDMFLARLAGQPIDVTGVGRRFAAVVEAEQPARRPTGL